MADKGRAEIVETPGIEHHLLCHECRVETVHVVLASANQEGYVDGPGIHWWIQNELVQCQGCRSVSFRQDDQNSEETYVDWDGSEELKHHERLFPPRIEGRAELDYLYYLPAQVQAIYKETHAAMVNDLPILAGVGVRAIVERVCKEKGAEGGTLNDKIDDLVTRGVLTAEGGEILHGTRLLGNKAAHEQEPVGEGVLNAAVEVVEHLLKTVFILPKIAENLPKRDRSEDGGA